MLLLDKLFNQSEMVNKILPGGTHSALEKMARFSQVHNFL